MRPKKIIFLFCTDEVRRSLLMFLLQTRGKYVVITAGEHADLALFIDDAKLDTEDLAHMLHPDVPLLVLKRKNRLGLNYPTRAIFISNEIKNEDLLECVRVVIRRKHGPKKKPDNAPALEEAVTA